MKKKDFLIVLNKALERKVNENDNLELDSLDVLKLVEMNNIYFQNFKVNTAKFLKCNNVKDLINIYKKQLN